MCTARFYDNVLFFAQEDSATYSSSRDMLFSIHRDSLTLILPLRFLGLHGDQLSHVQAAGGGCGTANWPALGRSL